MAAMPPRRGRLLKLARMDRREFAWRIQSTARTALDRAAAFVSPPAWRREDLTRILASTAPLAPVHRAAAAGKWLEAHRLLSQHLVESPQRFVIAAASRDPLVSALQAHLPAAARDAVRRADRIVTGSYDLLGYQGLRFESGSGSIDWHRDPVHGRQAPLVFWSALDYLDPAIGDHKIIWEINRFQHWLALGRAHWLSGDPRYREEAIRQLSSWLAANPPLAGINWASMLELSFRCLSWVWGLHFFAGGAPDDDAPWTVDLLVALDRQLTHVEHNLSHYFSPNTHLLGEALALYVCGRTLPQLKAHARREAVGRRVLLAEISRQIAADGGHCERSTHYHRYTLDFYLLALIVARITGDEAAPAFEAAVARLATAARLLADDRGLLPHLGDDDGGSLLPIAGRPTDDIRDSLATAAALLGRPEWRLGPVPEETCWMLAHEAFAAPLAAARSAGRSEPIGSAALPDTGYYVSRSTAGDHVVIDGGPHGYQNAGHAHADALSLTATVRGTPLLIDPGTGSYTVDNTLRDRLRSTALHNTLTIDDRPQSVPAGAFHWTRTADAAVESWRVNTGFDFFAGSHNGYAPASHHRHVLALHGDLLVVADLVRSDELLRADVHWHLDPRWRLTMAGRRAVATIPGERVEIAAPHGVLELFAADEITGLGWSSPVYGRVEPATTLRISQMGSAPLWVVTVFGLHQSNEVLDVETLPVWAEAGVLEDSLALRVTRAASVDTVLLARPATGRSAGTWRVGELETNARLLFCRTHAGGEVARLAMVDGSLVRTSGRRRTTVSVPRVVPDLHIDFGTGDARLSGPTVDAQVNVAGRELTVSADRRTMPRLRGVR
jgi:hypothetical protein